MGFKDLKRWHYVKLGIQRGPVTAAALGAMIESGELALDDVKVWREGMKEWLPVTEVKDFRKNIARLRECRAEVAAPDDDVVFHDTDELCRGVNRFAYHLFFYGGWLVVLFLAAAALVEARVYGWVDYPGIEDALWWKYLPIVVTAVVFLFVTMSRMKHAGYAETLGLALLVPVLNVGVLLLALCASQNYKHRKKMGVRGVVAFVFFCTTVAALIWAYPQGHLRSAEKILSNTQGYYWVKTNAGARYALAHEEQESRSDKQKQRREAEKAEKVERMRDRLGLD